MNIHSINLVQIPGPFCKTAKQNLIDHIQNKRPERLTYESIMFKGECNKYLLNKVPELNVSMSGTSQKVISKTISNPVDILKAALAEELKKNNIQRVPNIDTSGFIKDNFLLFKPYKNEIVIGKTHLNAMVSENGKNNLNDYVRTFTNAIKVYYDNKDSIDKIYKESASKLGYGKDKLPELSFIYLDINMVAANFRYGNLVILNAKWLEKASEPELLVSIALAHELSHFKTQLLYRSLKDNQKTITSEKIDNRVKESAVLGNGYDQTIKSFYESKTKGNTSTINTNRKRRILEEIAKIANLELYEVSSVDLLELLNNRVTFKDSHQVIATFGEDRKDKIAGILKQHLDEFKEIFRLYRLEETLQGVQKEYTENPDEILSRYNQVKITRQNILDGTIQLHNPDIHEMFLNIAPEQVTHEDFKDIHSSCRV